MSPIWPPSGPSIVGKGGVSLCSAPMVKVPKASGLEDRDGSGERGCEDGVGEGDNSGSRSLDGEGGVMSSC